MGHRWRGRGRARGGTSGTRSLGRWRILGLRSRGSASAASSAPDERRSPLPRRGSCPRRRHRGPGDSRDVQLQRLWRRWRRGGRGRLRKEPHLGALSPRRHEGGAAHRQAQRVRERHPLAQSRPRLSRPAGCAGGGQSVDHAGQGAVRHRDGAECGGGGGGRRGESERVHRLFPCVFGRDRTAGESREGEREGTGQEGVGGVGH
mmetsp:Transcript_22063/g.33530  ORF Transcript_22063/g.33530 Transcript_22063/m.33530 type:complete len:204 (+) Transcript_22063:241-852(+)